jgi:outer membrane protein assembly factor BamB
MKTTPFLKISLLLCISTSPLLAKDWPQWRGENRDDLSTETGLLKSWPDKGPEKVWMREDVGLGYSGPSISGGKIFIMGLFDDQEKLIALDEKTGKTLWKSNIGGHYENNWGDGPRATPTVDGANIYAMGAKGDLVCVTAKDGKEIWRKSMTADLGGSVPGWGYCESVLVDDDQVICSPGGKKGAIAALNKKTGDVIWRSTDVHDGAQYSSPIAIEHNGKRQYVQLFMNTLVGVDAKTGATLWSSEWDGRTAVIPTPIYADGHVYITSGYGVGSKLVKLGGAEPDDVYKTKTMKNHHGGVIKVGDYVYGHSDGGGWTCQNFMTGEEVWSNNDDLKKGAIAYADGMFYCLNEDDGTVALIEASPKEWIEKGRFKIEPQSEKRKKAGRIWMHPVIANGKLYLRDQEKFFCYDVKK